MKSTLIKNGRVVYGNLILDNHAVLIKGKNIESISPEHEFGNMAPDQVIDAQNNFVSPGFVDVHTHGGIGIDFMDASVEEISSVLKWMAGNGVVGLLPTIASANLKDQIRIVKILREVHELDPEGAKILGVHLEGPYLSVEKRGAQPLEALRSPDPDEIDQLVDVSGGLVKMISIAPELKGAIPLIATFSKQGIIFAAGHTTANYDQINQAIDAGLNHIIHLFNGMPALHHRNPGPAGAALLRDDVYAEIILDGHHVHPDVVKIVLRAKGNANVLLITDSSQAAGLEDGDYIRPGNRKIHVRNGVARLENGSLAGSTLTFDKAVSNAVSMLEFPVEDAVKLASLIPAQSLKLDREYGSLIVGQAANLTIFDQNVKILLTMIAGEIVFQGKTS